MATISVVLNARFQWFTKDAIMSVYMPSGPKQWSVDFVQHLRTVHFTLLAVAVSLALLANAPRKDIEAKTALPLISQIFNVHAAWPKDWVEMFRPDKAKDVVPANETVSFYIASVPRRPHSSGGDLPYANLSPDKQHPYGNSVLQTKGLQRLDVTLRAPRHSWSAEGKVTHEALERPYTVDVAESSSSLYADTPPATLGEFRDWWDKSRYTRVAFFTTWGRGGENYVEEDDGKGGFINQENVDWLPHTADQQTQTVDLDISPSRFYTGQVELPNGRRGRLALQAFGGGGFQVQNWRVAEFARERCGSIKGNEPLTDCGPFDKVFPELVEVERELGGLPLERLIDEVVKRASSGPEPMELLGMKFPIAALTQWGIVLLLTIQLYLWLHVHEMRGKIDLTDAPGLDVAWIGVYTSRISRVVFFISLLVPSFVVLLLAYYVPATLRTRVIVGALTGVFSAVLAFVTFHNTRFLANDKLSTASSSVSETRYDQSENNGKPAGFAGGQSS